jgi:pimeloyl-ACP methyl ester carboxylesterase
MLLNHSRLGFASLCGAVINAPTFDFGEIHVPFLLISSDEDTLAPPEKTFHIFRQVASRQKGMEVLGGVGSWHCIEAGDEISKFILDFTENLRT